MSGSYSQPGDKHVCLTRPVRARATRTRAPEKAGVAAPNETLPRRGQRRRGSRAPAKISRPLFTPPTSRSGMQPLATYGADLTGSQF